MSLGPVRRAVFIYILAVVLASVPAFRAQDARAQSAVPEDSSAAVILAYHRIGENAYPDTNLRTEQFAAHIEELTTGAYTVLPLPDIISALKNSQPLPARAVAITFEGAYKSALENAIPLLTKNNLPFTVFFASNHADNNAPLHMNWNNLKALQETGLASFGILPASHIRLYSSPRENILAQINKARTRFREELGHEAALFSYPFGEYSLSYKELLRDQEFEAALGLHSGTAFSGSDFHALPRFSMTESYGDLDRFRLVAGALPLPVSDLEPRDPYIRTRTPVIGFSAPGTLSRTLNTLSCFISGQPRPDMEIIGENRIELRLSEPLSEERTRINCTMPAGRADHDETPSWRWLGMLLIRDEDKKDKEEPETASPQQAGPPQPPG